MNKTLHNLGTVGDILGILIFPFVVIGLLIIAPFLLIKMYINYKIEEAKEREERRRELFKKACEEIEEAYYKYYNAPKVNEGWDLKSLKIYVDGKEVYRNE